MREAARILISLGLLTVGLLNVLASLAPRRFGPMRWKSGAAMGLVSRLGAIGIFIAAGLLTLGGGWLPDVVRAGCWLILLAGLPAILVGDWLDHRHRQG